MPEMTDEEYDALDERLTHSEIKLSGIPGVFARQKILLETLDPVAASYVKARADADNKTPSQIVSEIIRKTITAAAVM